MNLTDEHIAEFQMLYRKYFGKEISKEDAMVKGIRLIRLMEVVLKNSQPKPATNARQTAAQ